MSFRGINSTFLAALKNGYLSPVLQRVKLDRTLDLQIRDNYINIYYRGASLSKITDSSADFNLNYLKAYNEAVPAVLKKLNFPLPIKNSEDSDRLISLFPYLKEAVDLYLGTNEKCEREFQQLLSRTNNYSPISNDTDYLICDIEYTHSQYRELRLDLTAAKWPSNATDRKYPEKMKFALIEMKYGDGALCGSAGILKHVNDLKNIAPHMDTLRNEMITVLKQKSELGLILKSALNRNDRLEKISFSDTNSKPEWILVAADHKPESTVLFRELKNLKEIVDEEADFPFEIKIAVSSFMGFGLYEKKLHSLNNFLRLYS